MATFINKLFGKHKEEAILPLDSHAKRYMFETSQMASVSVYGISTVFTEADDKFGLFRSFLKSIKVLPEFVSSLKVKTYNIKEGQIAIFAFSDPQESPEAKYAICVFRTDAADSLSNLYDYSSPYYIMINIVDVWAIGEIALCSEKSDKYVTTYYKTMSSPDLQQFVKWVMEKEQLSADHSEDNISDPIAEYIDRTF